VFVQRNEKDYISSYQIISNGANLSDHSPIHFILAYNTNIQLSSSKLAKPQHVLEYRWDKGDCLNYNLYSGNLLNNMSHEFRCNEDCHCCNDTSHKLDIEIYDAEIVHCQSRSGLHSSNF